MCKRFTQSQTREEYLAYLAEEAGRDIAYDPEPIARTTWCQGQKFAPERTMNNCISTQ
ncbi:Uncharacterised protein [Raoultella planticola]|nr:Uncharacterised protein [Raoultella planticola]